MGTVQTNIRLDKELRGWYDKLGKAEDRDAAYFIKKALVQYRDDHISPEPTVKQEVVVSKKESKPKNDSGCEEVISYLNSAIGKNFKCGEPYKVLIRARMKEGYSLNDFKVVIDKKAKEWLGTDSAKYLRPQTLFGTKFDAYLNQVDTHSMEDSNQVDLEAWLNNEPDQSGEVFENGHY